MNLTGFADAIGVSRASQINYESGQHDPGWAYVSRLESLGVDWIYVAVGKRAPDFELDRIDWDLCEQILEDIHAWERARKKRVPAGKQLAVLRMVYAKSHGSGQVNKDAMLLGMKMVA